MDELERIYSRVPKVVRGLELVLGPMRLGVVCAGEEVPSGWPASSLQLLNRELQRWQTQTSLQYSRRNNSGQFPKLPLGKFQLGMSKNFFTRRAVQQWSRDPGIHRPWRFWSCGTPWVALSIAVLWQEGWISDLLKTWDLILQLLKPAVRPYQPKDWRLFQLHLLAQLDLLLLLWLTCKMTLKLFDCGWAEWYACFNRHKSWQQSLRLRSTEELMIFGVEGQGRVRWKR